MSNVKHFYSISVYEFVNTNSTATKVIARENYDLMTLVVIKLGDKVYNGNQEDEGYELLRFLNAIMYPHKEDFMATVSEYIDYSGNERLWKEVGTVLDWRELVYEGVVEEITEEVTEKVTEEGIQVFVLDNLEEQIPKERIIEKRQKRFNLTEEKSEQYYERFAVEA